MDYCQALEYLYTHTDYERDIPKKGMWRDHTSLKGLLTALGDPQDYLTRVNIVGTNGKGSTGAILSSILMNAQYKVGFYSSPHLRSIRERIQIDGKPIDKNAFATCMNDIKMAGDTKLRRRGFRTVFEILTALAFYHFRREGVDIAIMEAGMGGRLDATNIGRPDILCITPISYDHCNILGNDILDIAREKVCIIKENQLVASAPQKPEVTNLIKEYVRKKKAQLFTIKDDLKLELIHIDKTYTIFKVDGVEYKTHLIGHHQAKNCALAILTAKLLKHLNLTVSDEAIREGISRARWPGRFMFLNGNPDLILDGAHNPEGLNMFISTVKKIFPGVKPIAIVGINSNKDISTMLKMIGGFTGKVIFTSSNHPHASKPAELMSIFKRYCSNGSLKATTSVEEALKVARGMSNGAPIIITGSLYLIGDILDILDVEVFP